MLSIDYTAFRCFKASVVVAAAFAAGCGGGPKIAAVQTVPVTGKIFIGEKPLPGATALFTPAQGTKGTGGFGITDAEGKFIAGIDHTKPGVVPGTYTVTISKWTQKDGSPIPKGKTAADVEAVQVIPEAFSNPNLEYPKLVITIPPTGGEFDLKIPGGQ